MIETAIALTFAHMLADFVLQSDRMIAEKDRMPALLRHTAIVAVTAWIALGFALAPSVIAIIAASHLAFDRIKQETGAKGFRPFIIDQAAHLAVIALVSAVFPGAYASGIFATNTDNFWLLNNIPHAMVLGAGFIATVWAGGYAVGTLMQGIEVELPEEDAGDGTLRKGGQMIGRLERTMIFMLVLAGQTAAIGFLIAAKSVLRFSEVSRDKTHSMSEYVIIGTLASFAWGLGTAFATKTALGTLTP